MAEYKALRTIIPGDSVRINSTKSMIGHLLGAAGAVEAIASIQAIRTGAAGTCLFTSGAFYLSYVPHGTRIMLSNLSKFFRQQSLEHTPMSGCFALAHVHHFSCSCCNVCEGNASIGNQ